MVELGDAIMRIIIRRDSINVIGTLVADMCLRECAILDELRIKRHPRPFDVITKKCHRQFMRELIAYYLCVCEDFLESELPTPAERFMDMVADEAARSATRDRFLARPPYFQADLIERRTTSYARSISLSRSKLKLMPPHVKAEWLAARTALELRRIMSEKVDDPNELARSNSQCSSGFSGQLES
jgi:hypothetical protein